MTIRKKTSEVSVSLLYNLQIKYVLTNNDNLKSSSILYCLINSIKQCNVFRGTAGPEPSKQKA